MVIYVLKINIFDPNSASYFFILHNQAIWLYNKNHVEPIRS